MFGFKKSLKSKKYENSFFHLQFYKIDDKNTYTAGIRLFHALFQIFDKQTVEWNRKKIVKGTDKWLKIVHARGPKNSSCTGLARERWISNVFSPHIAMLLTKRKVTYSRPGFCLSCSRRHDDLRIPLKRNTVCNDAWNTRNTLDKMTK